MSGAYLSDLDEKRKNMAAFLGFITIRFHFTHDQVKLTRVPRCNRQERPIGILMTISEL